MLTIHSSRSTGTIFWHCSILHNRLSYELAATKGKFESAGTYSMKAWWGFSYLGRKKLNPPLPVVAGETQFFAPRSRPPQDLFFNSDLRQRASLSNRAWCSSNKATRGPESGPLFPAVHRPAACRDCFGKWPSLIDSAIVG